jgi:hypothetical protein
MSANLNLDNDHKTWGDLSDWTNPGCWGDDDPWDFPFLEFWDSIDLKVVINDPEEIVRLQKVWVLERLARANGDASNEQTGNGADHAKGNGAEPKEEEPSTPRAEAGEASKEEAPSTTPATLKDLKERPLWVGWRTMTLSGRDKPTKIPFNANSNGQARSDDPRTWTLFYRAEHWLKTKHNHGDGIGIMFAPIDETLHLAGIDLDTCRDPKTGALEPWALEVIQRFASYTEVSPSKTGVKIFFYYRLADKAELDKLFGGPNDGNEHHGKMFKKGGGGGEHPQAIEVHRSNRYFTVTGEQYENYAKLRIVSVKDIRWLLEIAGPALKGANAGNSAKSSSSGTYKGSANQGNDNWRSGKAFREGARLKAKGASYEEMRDALLGHADAEISEWARTKGSTNNERELHRVYDRVNDVLPEGCGYVHFRAYMVDHTYIHLPTMTGWPAASVNSRLPWLDMLDEHGQPMIDKKTGKPKKMKPNIFLDKTQPVDQLIWTPDEPMLVEDRYLDDGSGWKEHKGGHCLNSYKPPTIKHGDPRKAGPWLKLVRKLYHGGANRIVKYMAFKVQNPGKKINHALFLGGAPGIGKDSLLQPLVHAVGPWNFKEVKPSDLFETFNPFVKAVFLRISEAHDLGEVSRYQFYERIKTYTATPPDVIPCNDKYIRKCNVVNVMGVIITSNHKTDGIFLPADDRRHDVHWSECKREDFEPGYWDELWAWYENGGFEHVAAYLATLDISDFNPKAPPPKTPAFWAIVDANQAPEEGELADVIDLMGNPEALTLASLIGNASGNGGLAELLKDSKTRRNIPHRLKSCGYEQFRNPDAKDGYWKIGGKRHAVYVREELTVKERMEAVRGLVKAADELARAEEEWREALKEQGHATGEQAKAAKERAKAAEERVKAARARAKRGGAEPSFAGGPSI